MPPPSSPSTVDRTALAEALMTAIHEAYTRLAELAQEQRACLARADGAGVERCARAQMEIARRLADLDAQRMALTGPGTLTELIDHLPDPQGPRLRQRLPDLRGLVARVQREYRIVHQATSALVAHLDGIVQQVARRLSDTGTYGKGGRVEPRAIALSGVDLTL